MKQSPNLTVILCEQSLLIESLAFAVHRRSILLKSFHSEGFRRSEQWRDARIVRLSRPPLLRHACCVIRRQVKRRRKNDHDNNVNRAQGTLLMGRTIARYCSRSQTRFAVGEQARSITRHTNPGSGSEAIRDECLGMLVAFEVHLTVLIRMAISRSRDTEAGIPAPVRIVSPA